MDLGFLEADLLTEAEIEQIRSDDEVAVSVPEGEHAFAVIAGLGFDAAVVGRRR